MNTPRFSGAFKWSALRQQLLSLRDDVHTIRKVAGRNVTIEEHRGKGKVINVADSATRRPQVPVSLCGGCSLPSGDCPHAFCLEFALDSDDTSNRDLIEINGSSGNQIGFYYDQTGNWQLYAAGTGTQLVIPTADPHETWHSARIQITRVDDDNVHIVLTVDGNSDNGDFAWTAGDDAANIRVGALQGDSNPVHRTFRCVAALGNPDNSETDFFFPASSFDSLTAGASIDGSGFLRIDHGAVAVDDYGEKAVSYDLPCETTGACCIDGACSIKTEAECTDAGGTYQGDNTSCTPDPCCTDSKVVLIEGITFCDDCLFVTLVEGFKISDDTLAGTSYTLEGGILTDEGCIGCAWDSLTLETQPNIKVHDYGNGACTGSPNDYDDAPIIIAARIDDTYYVYAYAGFAGRKLALFYGSGSDPSEIENTLSGCATGFTLNNQFSDCTFGDGTPGSGVQITTVMATGGTAALT